jgi:arsenate reductase
MMAQIETSNRQITLYCIENSNRAKQTLVYAKALGVPVLTIDISKTPITGSQIFEIANRLGMEIKDLIYRDNDVFNSKSEPINLEALNLSSEDWIKMIQKNPEILKQPIAIRGDKTILVVTPTDILQL